MLPGKEVTTTGIDWVQEETLVHEELSARQEVALQAQEVTLLGKEVSLYKKEVPFGDLKWLW